MNLSVYVSLSHCTWLHSEFCVKLDAISRYLTDGPSLMACTLFFHSIYHLHKVDKIVS